MRAVEGDAVEEAQGAHHLADAGRLEAAGEQVQLVVPHVLQGQLVGRTLHGSLGHPTNDTGELIAAP